MLTYILSLLGLPLLCVLWIVFQEWLAKNSPDYKGYKAGCGGCSRSCGDPETKAADIKKHHNVDADSLLHKHNQ